MQTAIAFVVGVVLTGVIGWFLYRKYVVRKLGLEERDPFVHEEANAVANLEYQFEFPPNPDCASIHLNRALINDMIVVWDSSAQAEHGGGFTPVAPDWVKKIFALQGIEKVTLHPHQIGFVKGRMYRWDDILPPVLEILREQFAPEMKVEQTKAPHRWYLNRRGCQADDDINLGDLSSVN